MMSLLRKYLIAGLLVWLPVAATVIIIKLVIDLLDKTLLLLPYEWRPETLLGFSVPGFGLLLGLSLLIITGVLAANFFGRKLVNLMGIDTRTHTAGQEYLYQCETGLHHLTGNR